MFKKITAVLLTLVLMAATFPLSAFAARTDENSPSVRQNMRVQANNSFGSLMADNLEQEQERLEESGCAIVSAEVEGKTAVVDFFVTQSAVLVAAIYDEAGETLLATGQQTVTPDDETVRIPIDAEQMPQYFYLRVFLNAPDSQRPLCEAYSSPKYTRDMQELLASDVDDYDGDKVLNLDDDKQNNFAVYKDGVKQIDYIDGKNTVAQADDDALHYVIENADRQFTSLQSGDIFSYVYSGDGVLIVKVRDITVSGDTVTIDGDSMEMTDAFDYIKIDSEAYTTSCEYSDEGLDPNLTYEGIEDEDSDSEAVGDAAGNVEATTAAFKISMDKEGTLGRAKYKISGSVSFKPTIKLEFNVTPFYQFIELKIDVTFKMAASIDLKGALTIPLGMVIVNPIPAISLVFDPDFVIEASVKVEVNVTVKFAVGFGFANTDGFRNLCSGPKCDCNFQIEGKLFIGLDLKPAVHILGPVVKGELSAKVGAEITAKLEPLSYKEVGRWRHECAACLDGSVDGKITVSTKVVFLGWDKLTFEQTLADLTFHLFDFYYSLDFNEFRLGDCEHKVYRTTLTVMDENKNPVSGVKLTIKDAKGKTFEGVTNQNGRWRDYLHHGYCSVTAADASGKEYKDDFIVKKDATKTTIYLTDKPTAPKSASGGSGSAPWQGEERPMGEITSIAAADSLNYLLLDEYGDLYWKGGARMYDPYPDEHDGSIQYRSCISDYYPTKVLSNIRQMDMSMDQGFIGAVTNDGKLYTFGSNGLFYNYYTYGPVTPKYVCLPTLQPIDNVKLVRFGAWHAGAITNDGDLYMWGGNQYGECGVSHEDSDEHFIMPSGYDAVSAPRKILSGVKDAAMGYHFTLALMENGDLYSFGDNSSGQLGDGTYGDDATRFTPKKIMSNIVSISAAGANGAAIDTNGDLYLWGDNGEGQIGNGKYGYHDSYGIVCEPSPVKIFSHVSKVSVGGWHRFGGAGSALIDNNGDLYVWGSGSIGNGKVGFTGDYADTSVQTTPVRIMSDVKDVACACGGGLVLDEDGKLYAWGESIEEIPDTDSDEEIQSYLTYNYGTGRNYWSYYLPCTSVTADYPKRIDVTGANIKPVILEKGIARDTPESDAVGATLYGHAQFTELVPGEIYNFYSVKYRDASNFYSTDNLLYLTQAVTDENGTLDVSFISNTEWNGAVNYVVPVHQTDLSDAEVTLSAYELDPTGEEQEVDVTGVWFDDKALTEGVDYVTEGGWICRDGGEYTVKVVGIGLYTGAATATYTVIDPQYDAYQSKHPYVRGEEESVTITRENAEYLEITFSDSTYVESPDLLDILDGDGEYIQSYRGGVVYVPGDTAIVRIRYGESEYPNESYGFHVKSVVAHYQTGDVNHDGRIDVNDATQVQRCIAELLTLTDEEWEAADVNYDGRVDILDVTGIQNMIAEIY